MKLFIVLIGGKGYTSLVNPQVVLLRETVLRFPQSFYYDVRSLSAPMLPRSGTLDLGWLNDLKINNLNQCLIMHEMTKKSIISQGWVLGQINQKSHPISVKKK